MVNILINKITGAMAKIPANGDLGSDGNAMLSDINYETIELTEEQEELYSRGLLKYSNGGLVIISDDELPELTGLE